VGMDNRQGRGAVITLLSGMTLLLGLALAFAVLSGVAMAGKPPGPAAIPGFLDPATGRFAPLAIEPSTAGQEVSGIADIAPIFHFDPDFTADDTIFCTVTLIFGNVVNNQLFSNHTASTSANFAAGEPITVLTLPYAYTPNSNNAKYRLEIECRGVGDSGTNHSIDIFFPAQDLPNGNVKQRPEVDL